MEDIEKQWNDKGIKLYPHQSEGIKCMENWISKGHGGIMADEMGLGKTCQAVVLLTRLLTKKKGPFLVIAPLSVCDHWNEEVKRFGLGLLVPIKLTGCEAERQRILEDNIVAKNNVLITAPHIFIRESTIEFLRKQQKKLPFSTIVIDEAQCVKNHNTQLAITSRNLVEQVATDFVLLTGTPIQNDLTELYSMLSFANPHVFPIEESDKFTNKYKSPANIEQLKQILKTYMFRRTKDEIFAGEMEKCEQVVVYHGVSQIQKDLYRNIISKNSEAFQEKNNVKLTNILMQLRKCVIHPYMFSGIEPEPFEEGEHLVEASGKLQILDRLLKYCNSNGHRCLIFSQFLGALDIVEDFLRMRRWTYERLDGNCRSEERTEKINSFQKRKNVEGPLCFLLSTKAGGVGLTLTAADTVIFLDSDWNPQNDIQAMARCHRIGQTKAVKVIRLVARFTVDQYVVAKARDKLKLTDDIMGTKDSELQATDIVSMLRTQFGLLMEAKTHTCECSDKELEALIGRTVKGNWQLLDKHGAGSFLLNPDECDDKDVDKDDYCTFEGVSYRGKTEEWDKLIESSAAGNKENTKRKREYKKLREDTSSPIPRKKKRQTKEQIWMAKRYTSHNLMEPEDVNVDNTNQEDVPLKYVYGDVTKPGLRSGGKDLILHCVDNGGEFGTGGVFNAIRSLDSSIPDGYERAGKMKDLHLGDAHLFSVSLNEPSSSSTDLKVALLVSQGNNRGVMKPDVLESCLRRVSHFTRQEGCTIHTPRLGKGTDISWYMVDRLLKKHFSLQGIPCFVYYHPPSSRRSQSPPVDEAMTPNSAIKTPKRNGEPSKNTPVRAVEKKIKQNEEAEKISSSMDTRRPKRKASQLNVSKAKADEKKEEENSDSSESSGESSASENDWSTESEDEEDSDEDFIDEEELEDSPKKRIDPLKKASHMKVQKVKKPGFIKMPIDPKLAVESSDEEEIISPPEESTDNPKGKADLAICVEESDEDERVSPTARLTPRFYYKEYIKVSPIFKNEIFALNLFDEDGMKNSIKRIINEYGGNVVIGEKNLWKATIVIVPQSIVEEVEKIQSLYDKDCHFVQEGFIQAATAAESLDDLPFFVV